MALKNYRPMTPSQRELVLVDRSELWKGKPVRELTEGIASRGGRNNLGRVTMRRRGGGHKRRYRIVDFKRRKFDVSATVERLEYDPNRSAFIALIKYDDGEIAYILAPQRVKAGDTVISGERVDIKPGNALPMENIPVGTIIHNIEMRPGKGGQIARSAGTYAQLIGKRAAHGSCALHGDHRRGVQPGSEEHQYRQGRAQSLARRASVGARRRDEPGRPSARRRRRPYLRRPASGDAVGQADQGQEDPRQEAVG
jgi:large subunit ribosomal protein L2